MKKKDRAGLSTDAREMLDAIEVNGDGYAKEAYFRRVLGREDVAGVIQELIDAGAIRVSADWPGEYERTYAPPPPFVRQVAEALGSRIRVREGAVGARGQVLNYHINLPEKYPGALARPGDHTLIFRYAEEYQTWLVGMSYLGEWYASNRRDLEVDPIATPEEAFQDTMQAYRDRMQIALSLVDRLLSLAPSP